MLCTFRRYTFYHDDVIKWKHFPRYWPSVWGIHRSPVNSPHKGQWRGALVFFFICVWINGWVKNREAGDLRRHRAHYDVTIMYADQPWTDPSWIYNFAISDYADWFANLCNKENGACHRAVAAEGTTLLAKKVVTPRDDVSFLWLFLFHQSARSKDRLFGVI